MLGMSFRREIGLLLTVAMAAACESVSPDPAEMASELPVEGRALTADEERRVVEFTESALAALERGDHVTAGRTAEATLELAPRTARALAVLAMSRRARADAEDPPILRLLNRAEGELRQASKIAPDDGVVALLHGRFLESIGHVSAAVDRAEGALVRRPDDPDLMELAARLRYELGDERLAVAWFERLLRVQPDNADALYCVGTCSLSIAATSRDQARELALERAVSSFAAYRGLRRDDADGCLGEARARAELIPRDETAREPGAIDEVLELFGHAARLDPASPRADHDRGVFLERIEREAEAREAYEAALRRRPGHVSSLLNLAANQAAAGLDEAARANCRRALLLELTREERRRIEDYLAEPEGDPEAEEDSETIGEPGRDGATRR